MLRISLTLLLIHFTSFANTIEFSSFSQLVTCNKISNGLIPVVEPFNDGSTVGTAIGYNWKKLPVARTIIADSTQNTHIMLSSTPRLSQTENGCLFNFVATSPNGFDFYKPNFEQKQSYRGKLISARLVKIN